MTPGKIKTLKMIVTCVATLWFAWSACAKAAPALDFNQALDMIMSRSTSIGVQATKTEASSAGVFGAKSAFLPTLSVSASQNGPTDVFPVTTNSVSVNTTLNIFRGGADLNSVRAANSDLASQKAQLANTGLSQEAEGVQALVTLIDKDLEYEVLDSQVKLFNTYLTIARERYARGFLALQEVDKVSVDMANVEAQKKDIQLQQENARGALERLLGPVDVKAQWPWKDRVAGPAVKALLTQPFHFEDRPDYQAALNSLETQEHLTSKAYDLLFPSLDFTYSYGWSQASAYPTYSSGVLSLSLPIFDRLQEYSGYLIQKQNESAARYDLQQTEWNASSQWNAAKGAFEVALTTALDREKTLDISRRLYTAEVARFRQGHATANDLQVDESRLRDSDILAIQGWAGVHNAFMQLCHALGRSVRHCE